METAKLDNRKRVVISKGKPGQIMPITNHGDGSFTLVPAVEKEPVEVKPIKLKNGLYMMPVKIDRAEIIAAIRADRDAR